MKYSISFQESTYTINGSDVLHIILHSEDRADSDNRVEFNLTVSSTNGHYSQTWPSVLLPSGSKSVSVPFVVPLEWANNTTILDLNGDNGAINASMSVTYTLTAGYSQFIHTYKGYHTYLGVKVDESLLPSVGTLQYQAVDGKVPSDWDCLVQNLSVVRVTVPEPTGAYQSEIYYYYFNGSKRQTQNFADISLRTAGDVTINVMVEDSRGRFASQDLYLSVQPYAPPNLTEVSAMRCDAEGVLAEEGANFMAKGTLAASPVAGNNQTTVQVAWKKVTDETYGMPQQIQPDDGAIVEAGLEVGASYDVRYTIQDQFYTIQLYDYLSSTTYLLHFLKGGSGIAVGKAAEQSHLFDVALNTTLRRNLTVGGNAEVTGELTLSGVSVRDTLQSLQTPMQTAFLANATSFPLGDVTENKIIRCGRWVLYSFKATLTGDEDSLFTGAEHVVGSIPAGYFDPACLPQLQCVQGGVTPCMVTVSEIGQVKIVLSKSYVQSIQVTGVGMILTDQAEM